VVIDKDGGERWLTVMREKRKKVCSWSKREKERKGGEGRWWVGILQNCPFF